MSTLFSSHSPKQGASQLLFPISLFLPINCTHWSTGTTYGKSSCVTGQIYLKPFYAVCASLCGKSEFINCRSFIQNVDEKVFASERHLHVLPVTTAGFLISPLEGSVAGRLCRGKRGGVAFTSQPSKNDLWSSSHGTFLGWEDFKPFPHRTESP